MAITMIVKTSDLSNHNRSDPEYYLPNHTTIESYLEKVPTLPLGSLGDFLIMIIYSIIYLILFVLIDYNWIEIFRSIDINVDWIKL